MQYLFFWVWVWFAFFLMSVYLHQYNCEFFFFLFRSRTEPRLSWCYLSTLPMSCSPWWLIYLFKFYFIFYYMICLHVYLCTTCVPCACRGQKCLWEFLELESDGCKLSAEPRSAGRAASTLKHWAISPNHDLSIKKKCNHMFFFLRYKISFNFIYYLFICVLI